MVKQLKHCKHLFYEAGLTQGSVDAAYQYMLCFRREKNQRRCSVCFKRYSVSSNMTSYGSAVSDFIISNYIIVTVYCNLRKKKATLKISKKSREKICALLSFLIKLHTVHLQIYQKEILVQALVSKSMEWLLYDRDLRHERVTYFFKS